MARMDEVRLAQRVAHALQAIRRGEADAVEIRGSWDDQELAKTVVADFVQAFDVDVIVTELSDGFTVATRNPGGITIALDL